MAVTVIELTIRLVAADTACVDMAIMLVNIAIIMVSDNNLFFIFFNSFRRPICMFGPILIINVNFSFVNIYLLILLLTFVLLYGILFVY